MTDRRSNLIIKLDGLGDWIIFEFFLKQLHGEIQNGDLLIDSGSLDYFNASELNRTFATVYSFDFRGNAIHSFFRKRKSCFFIEKWLVKSQLGALSRKYHSVIVSVWNRSLEEFIKNYILSNLDFDELFIPSKFGLNTASNTLFRGELERMFLETVFLKDLRPIEYKSKRSIPKKIFIFATSFKANKRWPAQRYIELAKWLLNCGLKVSLWGLVNTRSNSSCFIKKGDIIALIEDLRNSDVYLGNDTGIMHLAIQLNKRVIVIDNGIMPNSFLNYTGEALEVLNGRDGKIETVTLNDVMTYFEKNLL